jgi:hypothetical protein
MAVLACLVVASVLASNAQAQSCPRAKPLRSTVIVGSYVAVQAVVIGVRSDDWWPEDSTTSFHFTWDQSPALGQDRLLHAYLAYQVSQVSALAFDWACFNPVAAGWLGFALGAAATLPKEIGDGFREGFDVPDFLAGVAGAALPAMHRTWAPTRAFLLKMNYWPSEEFENRDGAQPQVESDYAGMRFYLAFNPGRLPGGASPLPDWLGLAVGHSVTQWLSEPKEHQYYVALDVSFRGIPIRAKWWHPVATVLDQFKMPLPGIKVEGGKVFFGLY